MAPSRTTRFEGRPSKRPAAGWQRSLHLAIRSPEELARALRLSAADLAHLPVSLDACRDFPMLVPRELMARMRVGDPRDPLLLQVWPALAEDDAASGYRLDPLEEVAALRGNGLVHKYAGRVLLVTTGACAVHCRYCFRRHFPYAENRLDEAAMTQALRYLEGDRSIREVIFSGGDPLMLSDNRLAALVERLQVVPHLSDLRLHTRLPVVIPGRVDEALLSWIRRSRLQVTVVLHVNHANEIDAEVDAAVERLRRVVPLVLNQAVLLRGVNDHVDDQVALSRALHRCGIVPYYLHQLDPVVGAAHFEVGDTEALALERELRSRLPGYLVPRFVREVPGELSKQPLHRLH